MTGGDGAAAAATGMENARNEPARKGPKLRRPNDPPARYGPLEEEFTVEINYSGFLYGFGSANLMASKQDLMAVKQILGHLCG